MLTLCEQWNSRAKNKHMNFSLERFLYFQFFYPGRVTRRGARMVQIWAGVRSRQALQASCQGGDCNTGQHQDVAGQLQRRRHLLVQQFRRELRATLSPERGLIGPESGLIGSQDWHSPGVSTRENKYVASHDNIEFNKFIPKSSLKSSQQIP